MALKLPNQRKIKHSMKKVVVLFVSIALVVTVRGQSKFSFGPNAGIGRSWISNTQDVKSLLAGNVGLSLVYSAAEHFGIGLDTKYSFEGGQSTVANITTTSNLNYVRLPLKAIYFFNKYGSKVRPKAFVGPSFGFLAGGEVEVIRNNAILETRKAKDLYNSFDFGVTAGAGLNIRLVKNTWFNTDINYLHGVSNIVKNNSGGNNYNRNFSVNLGVNFGL